VSVVAVANEDRVVAAVRLFASADMSTCGFEELQALAGVLQRVRGFVSAGDIAMARRHDELTDATHSGAPSDVACGESGDQPSAEAVEADGPSTVDGERLDLSGLAGGRDLRPGREAEQDRARARVCVLLPMFEAAVSEGRIDAAHVDAVAAAWADLDDDERVELAGFGEKLLGYATVETAERFRRRVRDLARRIARDHGQRVAERQRAEASVRRWIDRNGMGHLHAELDPETTAKVWAALDQHLADVRSRDDTAGVPLQRVEVDARTELVTRSAAVDPRAPELVVLIDLATLQSGVFAEGSICETSDGLPLTPAAVRRLACEAGILPVVLGGDGVPVDVGRTRRLATREQRRALAAMYATCAMPACGVRFDRCRIHHCVPWLPLGPTDLANLLPVCNRHHHDVHEGGWTMTMTPDRVITLRAPDGTITFHGDTRDRIAAEAVDDSDIPILRLHFEDQRLVAGPDTDLTDWLAAALLAAVVTARTATRTRRRSATDADSVSTELESSQPRRGP
jgi:Domain of unknown function (DUF222)